MVFYVHKHIKCCVVVIISFSDFADVALHVSVIIYTLTNTLGSEKWPIRLKFEFSFYGEGNSFMCLLSTEIKPS